MFAKAKDDFYILEGHASKELKGEFVKYVLGFEKISRNDLKQFTHSSGHLYSEKFSDKDKVVYLK